LPEEFALLLSPTPYDFKYVMPQEEFAQRVPVREWNHLRITRQGVTLEWEVNGVKLARMEAAKQTPAFVAFDTATVGEMKVRNLRIHERLLAGWGEIIDPAGDCKFEEKDGTLNVTLPAGFRDLHAHPAFNLRAPRILQEVAGDFTVDVHVGELEKVDARPAAGAAFAFAGAGLVVWENERHFLRYLRGYSPGAEKPATLETHWFKDDLIGGLPPRDDVPYLRIQRKGADLHLWTSKDGITWEDERVVRDFSGARKLRVGVAALSTLDKQVTFRLQQWKLDAGWVPFFNGKDLAGRKTIEKALQAFEGTWELAAREVDGKKTPLSHKGPARFTFKDGKYVHRIGDKISGTGTITVNPATRPMSITIKHDIGTAKEMPIEGIYEITGEELRMALSEPGVPRPTRFESANKQALETWRRVQE
jgi:uncharacterized protein (TIGR03067 family)